MADEEKDNSWMFEIFNKDMIAAKTEQWTKEAEEAGMTLTEYLEFISPLGGEKCERCGKPTSYMAYFCHECAVELLGEPPKPFKPMTESEEKNDTHI